MEANRIDLNCDLGESFGVYTLGMDEAVLPYVSSANIACGWHAGDPMVMKETVRLAAQHGVNCGAHPGYPDLLGFGRRAMTVDAEELQSYMIYQIGALEAFCRVNGTTLHHVKPHGSLYLKAVECESTAAAVIKAIAAINHDLLYITLAGAKGRMPARIAADMGIRVAFEAFPDRAYTAEGTLAPRSMEGAVIKDPEEVVRRAIKMAAEQCIETLEGTTIELEAHTLCVHGDNPQAVAMVRDIRRALGENGVAVGRIAN